MPESIWSKVRRNEVAKRVNAEMRAKYEPREMIGFFAQLTPEQQKAALEYRGEDC